jgi:hypothetical protein
MKEISLIDSDRKMIEDLKDNLLLYEREWRIFKTYYPKDARKISKVNFINLCITKYYNK